MHKPLRIGTRGSQLALWQARAVATRLEAFGFDAELVLIKTSGDRLQSAPMSEAGTKRLFVKEIEDALLAGAVDAAVHSAKDMPAELPAGLAIAATLPREDPRDVFVLPAGHTADDVTAALAKRPDLRIGTSSIRRTAQLRPRFASAAFAPIRGNVDTRLRKLDAGEYDALILATGFRRQSLRTTACPPRDKGLSRSRFERTTRTVGRPSAGFTTPWRQQRWKRSARSWLHWAVAANCRSARWPA
jgi:hydroxymethylbilane synthase